MAKLFDTHERIVPTWLAVCRHLLAPDSSTDMFNAVVEISDPVSFREEDRVILQRVAEKHRAIGKALPWRTVANTIFPSALYRRYGRPEFYRRYVHVAQQTRIKRQTWGTYAQRMMHPNRNVEYSVADNQLEKLIHKLSSVITGDVNRKKAAYELDVQGDPVIGHEKEPQSEVDTGGEISIYSPNCDGKKYSNMPCLSHISFNLAVDDRLHLSALYRSHYYGARALGNFIGLAELLQFVAAESGASVGTLTCLSTFAHFDVEPFGGVRAARQLLETFP